MVFWCRINQSRLKHLTHQLKRSYTQVPSPNYSFTHTKIFAADNPFWGIVRRPTDFCNNVSFFAAPFQAQQQKEEKDSSGPRLNDQIKRHIVRLVTDEGHRVVSRHEALTLARKLELDLVEVQRYADPPVCKIMDYHKEKYKKEVREKDSAKTKSDRTLKKGGCKEVRFSGKIEEKDLKMKADTVQRLIERGYRVKCMALPVGKKEAEDLGGYLSRLTALIEDISVVESGPHVERKQAYVILRHVKFGPPKKGGAKKLMAVRDASGVSKTATWKQTIDRSGDIPSPTFSEEDLEEFGLESEDEMFSDEVDLPSCPPTVMRDKNIGKNNATWSVLNSSDDFNKLFDLPDDMNALKVMNGAPETARHPANLDASNFSLPKPVVGFSRADTLRPTPGEPSPVTENRCQRSEPRNQFPQKSIDNPGLGVRESFGLEPPQFPNQRRQPPPNMNISPAMGEQKQGGTDASASRNPNLPNIMPRQEPSHQQVPNTRAPGYGVFSSAKANAPATKGRPSHSLRNSGTAGVGANQNIPGLKSDSSQSSGLDNGGHGKFGIFSK